LKFRLQLILGYLLVFCYQISQIFISNILFLLVFIRQIYRTFFNITYNSGFVTRMFLFFFIAYITLDTVFYSFFYKSLDTRSIIQLLYNFHYIFLIIYIDLDYVYLKKIIVRASILLSHILILHFLISGDSLEMYKWNQFLFDFLPGWPNTLILYFIFSIFLIRKGKNSIYFKSILIFALFLTGSRGGLLGAICVLLIPTIRDNLKYTKILSLSIFTLLVIYWNTLYDLYSNLKFFRSFDRIDIFLTTLSYVEQRVLFGYGGNTIEQLSDVKIDHIPLQDWGHAHGFILEFALRYGLIGLILFLLFLYFKIREIKDFAWRFLFCLFIVLAFFQTYMRDFTFLSILIIISHYKNFTSKKSIN